jgi:hypothetical protein
VVGTVTRYYRVMTQSVYYVCLFLDPQINMSYVENNWEEIWVREGEGRSQAAWSRCKDLPVESPGRQPIVRSATTAGRRFLPNPFLRDIEMSARQQQLQTRST